MPTIKRLYIETGRIRYILKPLPTSPANLAIALHALTLCAGSSRYYPLADAFFERQRDIFEAASAETGPKSIIFAIAEDAGGLSNSASEACLRDPNRVAQVMASNRDGIAAGVTGTPTIFVNGVLVSVPPDQQQLQLATITQAIDAALRTASQRSVQPKSQSQSQSKAKKAKKR